MVLEQLDIQSQKKNQKEFHLTLTPYTTLTQSGLQISV